MGEGSTFPKFPGSDPLQRPERISDQLYSDLLNGILVGDFPTGCKLPTEESLARDYGISRTTVRVALNQLKSEGLVVSRQGAGTEVADFHNSTSRPLASQESMDELKKCLDCRIVFEPEIAAAVSRLWVEEDFRYFEEHLSAFEEQVSEGRGYTAEDVEFHLHLARLSGNGFFVSIMNFLRPHILFGMNLIKILPTEARELHGKLSLAEHKAIIRAFAMRDAGKARDAMLVHLRQAKDRVFQKV